MDEKLLSDLWQAVYDAACAMKYITPQRAAVEGLPERLAFAAGLIYEAENEAWEARMAPVFEAFGQAGKQP